MPQTDDFPQPREPGPDRRDNVASTGLDPDTWTELEEWRTENQLKRSEAVRRLIRTGLEAEKNPHTVSGAFILIWIGSILVSAQYANATGSAGPLGVGAIVVGFLLTREQIVYQVKELIGRARTTLGSEPPDEQG